MNYLATAGILIFVTSIISAVIVYLKAPRKIISIPWSLFSLSVSIWGFGLLKAFTTEVKEIALFWSYFLNLVAILLPLFFFHFVLSFSNKLQKKKTELISYYFGIALYFIMALIAPSDFISDVSSRLSFQYYPVPGFLYYFFPISFGYFVIYGISLLYREFTLANSSRRNQIKYLLSGVCVGFAGGSTTFFPVFGIDIPPIGTFLVPIYVLTVA